MLGWIMFGICAYSAYLWGNIFAISVAALNFWSLGIMSNYAGKNGIGADPENNTERLAILVNAVTDALGILLLVTAFVR